MSAVVKFDAPDSTPAGLATPLVRQARELARVAVAEGDDAGRLEVLWHLVAMLGDVEEVLAGRLTPADRPEPLRSAVVLRRSP